MIFGSCCQPPDDPHPTDDRVWKFANGTAVIAGSKASAVDLLSNVRTDHFWASEVELGRWDIVFDDHVTVERIDSRSALDAVQNARWYLQLDATAKKLLHG